MPLLISSHTWTGRRGIHSKVLGLLQPVRMIRRHIDKTNFRYEHDPYNWGWDHWYTRSSWITKLDWIIFNKITEPLISFSKIWIIYKQENHDKFISELDKNGTEIVDIDMIIKEIFNVDIITGNNDELFDNLFSNERKLIEKTLGFLTGRVISKARKIPDIIINNKEIKDNIIKYIFKEDPLR